MNFLRKKQVRNGVRKKTRLAFDRLELRNMLAGDVFVSVQNSVLQIVGDQLSNQVEVSTNANGNVVVTGLDTTINGSSDSVAISQPFVHVTASLQDGDDEIAFRSVQSPSHLTVLGGNGNDRTELESAGAYHLHLDGGSGSDVFHLNGTQIRKSSYVYAGAGDDLVAATAHTSGRNFKVFGGDGDDTFVSDALNVGRKFSVHLNNGNDQILIAGETSISKRTRISTGDGEDFVGLNPDVGEAVTFNQWVRIDAGNGNDLAALNERVRFDRVTRIDGGEATDSLQNNLARDKEVNFRNFENNDTAGLQGILDNIFARLAGNDIDSAPFGGDPIVQEELSLNVTNSDLSFIENSNPLTVDDGLQLTGDVQVESASVEISGFLPDQESLSFTESNGITGVFDSSTGILTLMGDASTADYQQLLRNIRYENTSDNPTSDDRLIGFTVFDENGASISGQRALVVQPVDDPLTLELPSPFNSDIAILRNQGETIIFTAIGGDPDNNLVFQLDLDESGIPASASQPQIDSSTGDFSWTLDTSGEFLIRVIAVNDLGEADQEEFTLSVN